MIAVYMAPSRTWLIPALLLVGCPTAEPEPEQATPPEPLPVDADEIEPNDELPNDLGVIDLPWAVGGTSHRCGNDGSWDDADVDLLSFEVAEPAIVQIDLQATGADLDLTVFDPGGDVLAHLDSPDAFGESVTISIGPGAAYSVKIRCWMGNDDASWRLVLGED